MLGAQQPSAPAGAHPLAPLPRPEEDLGPHQAYAYQWWLFMPAGLVFVSCAIRRQGPVGVPGSPGAGHGGPKKVRIWDEEDA